MFQATNNETINNRCLFVVWSGGTCNSATHSDRCSHIQNNYICDSIFVLGNAGASAPAATKMEAHGRCAEEGMQLDQWRVYI